MASPAPLSVAFIEKRPLSAARALAAISPDDAAALLETIPSRFTARAFHHMDAWAASSVTEQMTPVTAAAILRESDYPDAVAILRLLSSGAREKVLAEMPQKLRRDLEIALSYPADTVGAHMSTAVMCAGPAETVADALELMRRSPPAAGDVVFVVDKAKRLLGVAGAAALLRHSPGPALGDVMDDAPISMSARARLATVADFSAWERFAWLPVTNRQRQMTGVLSRTAVRLAFERTRAGGAARPASITIAMAEAFFTGTYGLARLLADIPAARGPRTEGE